MINATRVTVLPIGEFDTDLIQTEFDSIVRAFNGLETDLTISEPVSDEEGAKRCVLELSKGNFDLLLIIPLRGLSAQVIETVARLSQAPCLIWPVQGRFALPSSTLAVGALQEAGALVELLYAPPDHPTTVERIRYIARAAKAFSRIRHSHIGVIGGLFPNLVSCRYDPQTVSSRLGITLHSITFEEIRGYIQGTSHRLQEIEQSRQTITSSYTVDNADMKSLDSGLKLHLALKQIAQEQTIDAFATECWTGFPRELGLNPCLGFIDDTYTLACEGDVMACITLLIVRYLTGTRAYVGDLYDLDLDGGLTLVHCGAPASLASNKNEVVLAKSQLAMERGFETMTCRPRLAPGRVTLFRFYGQACDRMHVALGDLSSCDLSSNLEVKISITGNRWDFLEQCFGNHYIVVTGDIRPDLKLLSKWLRITLFET